MSKAVKDFIYSFIEKKYRKLSDNEMNRPLLEYLSSADFMELMLTIEVEFGCELELENLLPEHTRSLNHFIEWITQHESLG